jgi:hypothetical protein
MIQSPTSKLGVRRLLTMMSAPSQVYPKMDEIAPSDGNTIPFWSVLQ